MKVLDLHCDQAHRFEGWFGSEDDFQDQLARGLLTCPLCASSKVHRLPSAPRLNLGVARQDVEPAPASPSPSLAKGLPASTSMSAHDPQPQALQQLQRLWMSAARELMARTEDVGSRFAEEARRIHYGETQDRGIRGQTTPEERAALADEGIEVMSLVLPESLKGPVQ